MRILAAFLFLIFYTSVLGQAPQAINKFDSSFIGKSSTEKYIKTLFQCWGQLISEDKKKYYDSFSVSSISSSQEQCMVGKSKILLQKMLYRTNMGIPVFEFMDEILIENRNPSIRTFIVRLRISNTQPERDYLVKYIDNHKKIIDKILSIWAIDVKLMKFRSITVPAGIKCINPDYAE